MHSLPLIVPGTPVQNSTSRSSLQHGFVLIALALAWFAISPMARAVGPSNTSLGAGALGSLTLGAGNTAVGINALGLLTTANSNTAVGASALVLNTAADNTALGFGALGNNSTGTQNTATGFLALFDNATSNANTADGYSALYHNTTGTQNTATGVQALYLNNIGNTNTATGVNTLYSNTSGSQNTGTGWQALHSNSTGGNNTATGWATLNSNINGNNNTATGIQALHFNISGGSNTADGTNALLNSTGNNNTAVGTNAGANLTTGSNNIDIGNGGVAGESAKIRIGTKGTQTAAFIAGVFGKTASSSTALFINANGQLGTVQSSARFKQDIKPMEQASDAVLKLKPVTFRYKEELDPDGVPQFGLIAEEVEKVNPDLVIRDEDGKVSTVRYEAVNAMLLNEFLKAYRKLDQQQAMIDRQQKQIDALTSIVQKVSDQIAPSKPAPQLVTNP